MGQGRENAKAFLADHPEIALTIEQSILEQAGIQRLLAGEADS